MAIEKEKAKDLSDKEKYERYLQKNLCTFRTANRRCQILAQHYELSDKKLEYGLCGWHWLNQNTPKLLQDYEEFVKYRDRDRETYPKEWLQASLYVDDAIVWACILGKEQRKEFIRAVRAIENECDKELFGKSRNSKNATLDNPPTPEVSVQEYAESLPF